MQSELVGDHLPAAGLVKDRNHLQRQLGVVATGGFLRRALSRQGVGLREDRMQVLRAIDTESRS